MSPLRLLRQATASASPRAAALAAPPPAAPGEATALALAQSRLLSPGGAAPGGTENRAALTAALTTRLA